jgi:FtsP/CotA-like multicopper oxidase with cupredoxin domain
MRQNIKSSATALLLLAAVPLATQAGIDGLTGTSFNLTAKQSYLSTADGGSVFFWGYSDNGGSTAGLPQYPGPTLIVNQGDTVNIQLSNALGEPVSLVFPGQSGVTASCTNGGSDGSCVSGKLTTEAGNDGDVVTYSFIAGQPGTYMYHSGSHMDLQLEMGLLGALIVRPSLGADYAYNHADTRFDREYLFLLTEIDPKIHLQVALGQQAQVDNAGYFPVYWLLNGRTAPDDMSPAFADWLPTQPYNSVPRMHPGERVLMRVIGAGRDLHPFHHHGNHAAIIARDGRMLESEPGKGPDLAEQVFTTTTVPGSTSDAIFEWTGEHMGWDIYGSTLDDPSLRHDCIDQENNTTGELVPDGYADASSDFPWEWCADHDKPFPVTLPETQDLFFGAWWSGTPYLGSLGNLPPGEGGLNPNGGYSYMWHSHTEKELTNNDIYPGGILTMMIIEAPGVVIE